MPSCIANFIGKLPKLLSHDKIQLLLYFFKGQFLKKVDFCEKSKMKVDYNVFWVLDLRALAEDYSKLRKADLISLLRFHDASTRTSAKEVAQKQFDQEGSDNEDEVFLPFDDPTITEEGAQKQFSPEESDDEDEVYSSNDQTITEEGTQKQFGPEESDNEGLISLPKQLKQGKHTC